MPTPPSIALGVRVGELVVERLLPSRREYDGARVWLLRCLCGAAVVRSTGELQRYRRLGQTPCCRGCYRELCAGRAIERREQTRERLRTLWADRGQLYGVGELQRIEDDIRGQVGRELGGWDERADVPSSFAVDSTWRDSRRAPAVDAPELEADGEERPVATVEERRARALDAALDRARSSRPTPPPARGRWLDFLAAS